MNKRSNIDVWHKVTTQTLIEPLRYTWESLGKADVKKEAPFLLQSDVSIVECWKKHSRLLNRNVIFDNSSSIDNSQDTNLTFDDFITVSFFTFFRDVKCLLIAVNSSTFYFNKAS